jgi:hypothetical protein
MDPIDKLLSSLGDRPAPAPRPSADTPSQRSIDDLLSNLDDSPAPVSVPAPVPAPAPISAPAPMRLLETMQSEYAQQQAEAELERQRQAQQKARRLEQLQQQRRAELAETAAQWLRSLNPKSSEGQWFEEFACNYESRLEAAIDYLEALREAGSKPAP